MYMGERKIDGESNGITRENLQVLSLSFFSYVFTPSLFYSTWTSGKVNMHANLKCTLDAWAAEASETNGM